MKTGEKRGKDRLEKVLRMKEEVNGEMACIIKKVEEVEYEAKDSAGGQHS